MITPRQMAAARALVNLTQEQLAQLSHTSKTTIAKYESGDSITMDKLNKIAAALEQKGIEFIGKTGVIRREGNVKIIDGPHSCDLFYEDVLATVREKGGVVRGIFDTQDRFASCLGVPDKTFIKRLDSISQHAEVRGLLTSALKSQLVIPDFEFRAIPLSAIQPFFQLVYGDKVAVIVNFGGEVSTVVIHSVEKASLNSKLFDNDWNEAFPFSAIRPAQPAIAV